MKRDIYNDFEKFLKENADQYRLYPSAKVWKGIYASLHSRRKWFGLGIILLLMTGTGVTLLITNSSKQADMAYKEPQTVVPTFANNEAPIPSALQLTHTLAIKQPGENNNLIVPNHSTGVITTTPEKVFENIFSTNIVPEQPNTVPQQDLLALQSYNYRSFTSSIPFQITDELTDQSIGFSRTTNTRSENLFANNDLDLAIESVLNSYKRTSKKHKIGLQLNLTPTISYRKLSENKAFLNSAAANNPYTFTPLQDINSAVTHKPDMGLELGLTAKYGFAKNLKVITGVQFNVSRYDIKAFTNTLEVATIALNGRGSQVDSFQTVTNYRNYNGYKSNWLHNLYFQISMPVGIEMLVAGDDKVQLGVAGTIQPTYVLGDRAYLLSTDYKNYAEVPWLIRRWNANTAFETFVSYSTGKLKWQVGPQVRYQLLSSFIDKYPVKENLFDFGLKVGIQLNNQ